MRERFDRMVALRDHLTELFELCGVKKGEAAVMPISALRRLMDYVFEDKSLNLFLEETDLRTGEAIRLVKDRNIELWILDRMESDLDKSEAALKQAEEKLEQQNGILTQLREQLNKLQTEYAELQKTHQETEKQLDEKNQKVNFCLQQLDMNERAWIDHMIDMRNILLQNEDALEGLAESERSAAQKVIDAQMRKTAAILESVGTDILTCDGSFDGTFQMAAETKPTSDPTLNHHIAEKIVPGYRYKGEVLYPQQVVVYKTTEG